MKARYQAIYKIHGVNGLSNGAKHENLVEMSDPTLTATLTTEPERYFLDIDRENGVRAQLLKGLFAPDTLGTGSVEDRLAFEVEERRKARSETTRQGLFVVFYGESEFPNFEFRTRQDTDGFAVSMDDFPKDDMRAKFQPILQSILTALSLVLPEDADQTLECIGEAVFLYEESKSKPVYVVQFKGGGAWFSVSTSLKFESVAAATNILKLHDAEFRSLRFYRLLRASYDRKTSDLQRFVAAWSAIEIFINSTFKSHYEERWFNIMENGAPAAATQVFERFKEVMKDKYRLADKFLIIASLLDPASAADNDQVFREAKAKRDDFFHGKDIPVEALPTASVQHVLRELIKLHLGVTAHG
jgi:hypothetical protein